MSWYDLTNIGGGIFILILLGVGYMIMRSIPLTPEDEERIKNRNLDTFKQRKLKQYLREFDEEEEEGKNT
jgi:hypothetical protein